jgi:hypothetical protein
LPYALNARNTTNAAVVIKPRRKMILGRVWVD